MCQQNSLKSHLAIFQYESLFPNSNYLSRTIDDFIAVSATHHCIYLLPGASVVKYSARNTIKITSAAENIFSLFLLTKLTLTLTLELKEVKN